MYATGDEKLRTIEKATNSVSEQLVQRVNELFHDFTGEQYESLYPEILAQEKERWEKTAAQFLAFMHPIRIVDIGTGTGFVPLRIAGMLRKGDIFICSDISRGILEVARRNIQKCQFDCEFKFAKIDPQMPFKLEFDTCFADVVTMNSVLHHVKDTNAFLNEIDRILKPNGLLFIGHEPNRYFYESRFLVQNYLFLNRLFALYAKLHSYVQGKEPSRESEQSRSYYRDISQKISEILVQEGLINGHLSAEEITKIVDYQYFAAERGFLPNGLLSNYGLMHIETSDHLSWVSYLHRNIHLIRMYDNWLKKTFPRSGSVFFVVLKKYDKYPTANTVRRKTQEGASNSGAR